MSKESFLAEFYPIPANEATNSWLEATNHSIQKWKGMLPENLEKHNQYTDDGDVLTIGDSEYRITLRYGSNTCALCMKDYANGCIPCPLYTLTQESCRYYDSVYAYSLRNDNPQPMIDALYATQRFLLASAMPPSPRFIFSSPIMDFMEVPQ